VGYQKGAQTQGRTPFIAPGAFGCDYSSRRRDHLARRKLELYTGFSAPWVMKKDLVNRPGY